MESPNFLNVPILEIPELSNLELALGMATEDGWAIEDIECDGTPDDKVAATEKFLRNVYPDVFVVHSEALLEAWDNTMSTLHAAHRAGNQQQIDAADKTLLSVGRQLDEEAAQQLGIPVEAIWNTYKPNELKVELTAERVLRDELRKPESAQDKKLIAACKEQIPVIVDFADFVNEKLTPRKVLIETMDGTPVFTEKSINQIWAWRGTGKTNLELGIIKALATGGEFLNWRATGKHKVLLVEGEMPEEQMQERILELVGRVEKGMVNMVTLDKQNLHTIPSIASVKGQNFVEGALAKTGAKILFLDSISTLGKFGTNDEELWLDFLAWLQKLRSMGTMITFLHHGGKGGMQRGHSRSEDMLDVSIGLTKPEDTPMGGLSAVLKFDKFRGKGEMPSMTITLKGSVWSYKVNDEKKKFNTAAKLFEAGLNNNQVKKELNASGETVRRWREMWIDAKGGADAETVIAKVQSDKEKKQGEQDMKDDEAFIKAVRIAPNASHDEVAELMGVPKRRVNESAKRLGWRKVKDGQWVQDAVSANPENANF